MSKEEVRDRLQEKGFIVRDWDGNIKFTEKGISKVRNLLRKPTYAYMAASEVAKEESPKRELMAMSLKEFVK